MEKVQLWLEALRLFGRHAEEWFKWSMSFFLLWIPVNVLMTRYGQDMAQALKANPQDLTAVPILPFATVMLIMIILGLVQYYIYAVFFFGKMPLLRMPEFSLRGFGYVVLKAVQVILILMAIGMAMGFVLGVVVVIAKATHVITNMTVTANVAVIGILSIVLLGCAIYLGTRYSLAKGLAVNRAQMPLTASWQMTDGQFWRLFGNIILLTLFAWVPLWVITWLATLGMQAAAVPVNIQAIVSAVLTSAAQILFPGVLTAFNCVACCALYQEKKKSDSVFTLPTLT